MNNHTLFSGALLGLITAIAGYAPCALAQSLAVIPDDSPLATQTQSAALEIYEVASGHECISLTNEAVLTWPPEIGNNTAYMHPVPSEMVPMCLLPGDASGKDKKKFADCMKDEIGDCEDIETYVDEGDGDYVVMCMDG